MREIKFRGFSIDNQKWVYGSYLKDTTISDWHYILWLDKEKNVIIRDEVYTESLGQYVGLKDINGVDIYEGDIIQIKDHAFQRKEGSLSGIHIDGNYVVGYTDRMELVCGSWLLWNQRPYITAIGNNFDNPELLDAKP